MHLQMDVNPGVQARLQALLDEVKKLLDDEDLELAQLLRKWRATASPKLAEEYKLRNKAQRAQRSKATVNNLLRVVIELGLQHATLNDKAEVLKMMNKVGVARGYWNGKAA